MTITYLESNEGVHYLSLVTDAYSRKIVGHHLSKDMTAESVVKAMRIAKQYRFDRGESLIHHSDRGTQYCSDTYQKELNKQKVHPSTTDGGNGYQNALAERVNGILSRNLYCLNATHLPNLKS